MPHDGPVSVLSHARDVSCRPVLNVGLRIRHRFWTAEHNAISQTQADLLWKAKQYIFSAYRCGRISPPWSRLPQWLPQGDVDGRSRLQDAGEASCVVHDAMMSAAAADERRHWAGYRQVRSDLHHDLEDAAKVCAAAECGLPAVFVDIDEAAYPLKNPGYISRSSRLIWLGAGESDFMGTRPSNLAAEHSDTYWNYRSFLCAARRICVLAPTLGHAALAIRKMARLGHRKVFLKSTTPKFGLWTLNLTDGARSVGGAWDVIFDTLNASDIRVQQELSPGGWLVQEHRPMRNETRCFVVDHRLVGAVPVRRDDTVLCHTRGPGKKAEPRSSPVPDSPATVSDRSGVARRIRFARSVIKGIRTEDPLNYMSEYVLDVGDCARDGLPLAIEMNTMSNAGLYSMAPDVLLEAMIRTEMRVLNGSDPISQPKDRS
jgi:hypothetical protein